MNPSRADTAPEIGPSGFFHFLSITPLTASRGVRMIRITTSGGANERAAGEGHKEP